VELRRRPPPFAKNWVAKKGGLKGGKKKKKKKTEKGRSPSSGNTLLEKGRLKVAVTQTGNEKFPSHTHASSVKHERSPGSAERNRRACVYQKRKTAFLVGRSERPALVPVEGVS